MLTFVAVAVPIAIGCLIGIPYGLSVRKKQNALQSKGITVKRPYNFYKQSNLFCTSVDSLARVNDAMEKMLLREGRIAWEYRPQQNTIVFANDGALGSFSSSRRAMGYSSERGAYLYQYQLRKWTSGRNTGISVSDHTAAGLVLSVLERAFLKLDYDASVERSFAEFKVKTPFI